MSRRYYSAEFTKEDYAKFFDACTNNITQVIKKYIKLGIDANYKDGYGRTALMWAAYYDNTEIVKVLIGAGANLDSQDNYGSTALVWAATYGNKVEIAQMLIKAGASLDIQNKGGETALIMAAFYDNIEIVQLLLKAGANTKLEDKGGKTLLQYISPENMHNFIEYFPIAMQIELIELALFSKNYNTLYSIFPFIDETISQSEYNQLIRSKRLEDKLKLIFAENVSKKTLYYFSSDKEVGWVAKERYKELRSKLGRKHILSNQQVYNNWIVPSDSSLALEYKVEYLNHIKPHYGNIFKSVNDFINIVHNSEIITVTSSIDQRIGNRSHTESFEELHDLISGYRSYPEFRNEKTLRKLYYNFENNLPIDMPIILKSGSRMWIMSGNTRMDVAFQMGINPKAIVIQID